MIQSLEGIAQSDAKLVRDSLDQRPSMGAVFSKTVFLHEQGKKELVTNNAALVLAIADVEANLATLQATIQSLRHKPTARLAQRRLSTSAEVFETDVDVGRLIEQFERLLRHTLPKSALHSIKAKRILIALETIDATRLKSIEITLGDYLPFLLPLAPSTSKKTSSARHPDEDEDESYFSQYEDNTAKIRRHLEAAVVATPVATADQPSETSPRTTASMSALSTAESSSPPRLATSSAVDALVVKFTSRLRRHRHMPAARHHSLLVASAAVTLPVDDAPAPQLGKPSSHVRSCKIKEFAGTETASSLLDAPKLMTPDQLLPINEKSTLLQDESKAKFSLTTADAPSATTESDTPGGSKTKDLLGTKIMDAKAPVAASRLRRASVSLASSSSSTSGSAKAPRDASLGEQAIARRTEMSRMNDFERIALADTRLKTDGSFS
ncbi:hypothetical protein SPRG_17061 [Saprolegnia parasitica CBS 223.65]|uniref:Uncharacterized protein n=1 Tax=Saprolegnia parasitica (strain CBS 223.65) TaxID=695850 RepID=A0A067BLD9_SAPPC|nr:hypothetical protein SPRG_17061 [Saprolegnia parasitica CBS 223.65]KDO17550.1 hypothetical protein SPRG_17061 [Saprolegnia parasitica CBS 223.65]|eukprot:XP_012211743.1 hypothetical protein SPRG_17061 [Saprolegnia parasitica CBS 223.65]